MFVPKITFDFDETESASCYVPEDIFRECYLKCVDYQKALTEEQYFCELLQNGYSKILPEPVSILSISTRAKNALNERLIPGRTPTIGDLLLKSPKDLLALRNFGKSCLKEVEDELSRIGLHLRNNS